MQSHTICPAAMLVVGQTNQPLPPHRATGARTLSRRAHHNTLRRRGVVPRQTEGSRTRRDRHLACIASEKGKDAGKEVRRTKNKLLDLISGTNCGSRATEDQARDVDEAARSLEELWEGGATTSASGLLDGNWKLVYTTEKDVHAFLAPWLPLVGIQVSDIGQNIDIKSERVENRILLNTLSTTGIKAGAPLKVLSDCRIAYNFDYFQLFVGPLSPKIDLKKGPGGWTEVKYIDDSLRVMRNSRKDLLVLERVTETGPGSW